jgi:hypothetical protein
MKLKPNHAIKITTGNEASSSIQKLPQYLLIALRVVSTVRTGNSMSKFLNLPRACTLLTVGNRNKKTNILFYMIFILRLFTIYNDGHQQLKAGFSWQQNKPTDYKTIC